MNIDNITIIQKYFGNDSKKFNCMTNPYGKKDNCILMNDKKNVFYTYTYDPKAILNNTALALKMLNIDSKFLDIFDTTAYQNCCNCIAIILYLKETANVETIEKYIYSIKRSLENIQKNLQGWVARIYLDESVYRVINLASLDLQKAFDFIIHNDIAEIYTVYCDNNKDIGLDKTRILRFLPLIDPTVNICICREADGIISNLDCHNIKIFEKSNKAFYFAYTHGYMNNSTQIAYAIWLIKHKMIKNYKLFNRYDLLAGGFGTSLKLRKNIYYTQVKNELTGDNVVFDEIFLYEIYKNIISVPMDNDHESKMDVLENNIFIAKNNTTILKINDATYEQFIKNSIKLLIDMNIIKKKNYNNYIAFMLNFCEKNNILLKKYFTDYKMSKFLLLEYLFNKENVIYDKAINIALLHNGGEHISYATLLNTPYLKIFDELYKYEPLSGGQNYMEKYIKYNNKLNDLLNKIASQKNDIQKETYN